MKIMSEKLNWNKCAKRICKYMCRETIFRLATFRTMSHKTTKEVSQSIFF